jgi:hypothetical protein
MLLLAVGGCNMLAYPLYLFAPAEKNVTVKAEYPHLQGQTVAVVIYADMNTLYEYPYVRENLGYAIGGQLREHVDDVVLVAPERVSQYQDDTIDWESMPIQDIGEHLEADQVLYVSLGEYSTREAGSVSLARGRINAHVSVYDTDAEPGVDPVRWRQRNVAVTFPEEGPAGLVGAQDDGLQMQTNRLFAEKLARFFYDHEIPASEVEGS